MLFEPLEQIRVRHAMYKVTSFVDLGPYVKSFSSIARYIRWLKNLLIDIVTNPSHKLMEQSLSMVIHQMPL